MPHLQEACSRGRPEHALLQRSLPRCRPGKLGLRKVRHFNTRGPRYNSRIQCGSSGRLRRPGAWNRPGAVTRRPPVVPLAIATWFGCGYFPVGPGTAGSAAAALIAVGLHFGLGWNRPVLAGLIAVLLWPAIWSATATARYVGRVDPGLVVVDEVLGQWLTLLGASIRGWQTVLAAFLLFRLFDIWKPWPVRNFEKLSEGLGIVADDLAAGVYGALILYLGRALRLY